MVVVVLVLVMVVMTVLVVRTVVEGWRRWQQWGVHASAPSGRLFRTCLFVLQAAVLFGDCKVCCLQPQNTPLLDTLYLRKQPMEKMSFKHHHLLPGGGGGIRG